ncbi:unnamed protein product [Rotaria magnacalcarata]|uniref:C2H2-type domain-containing protein n=2 Tax=Rotaria magnacalcarata TaxID=392030 RepID=A0A815S235_9BILA|nr:unnamed protein product [Rotaria magnacalcarata]CAF1483295.1 unnamed protein product [Rotaria magnacalcarata]CAF2149144.1 unnamed protein product [Rotaria magnacalcarata]
MTPLDWSNVTKTGTFIQHTFGALPLIGSINDAGVLSVTSKSSSSKSCTLPSLTSTKHSRLSTPSLSSSDGKGKRALSFSPMSDNLLRQSQQQSMEINLISTVQRSDYLPPRVLAPLIEPNEIQCQWSGCDLLFSTPIQLTEHIRSVHINRTDSRTWLCQWQSCTRSRIPFKSLYSLFLHLRTHTQDRPFQCSHMGCAKTFTRAEYLRLHERSHTGEKPYPCEYADCSKAFSNPSDRTKHMKRTHLNKKEYTCQIPGCGKSYTDPSSLRKHVKTIHGEDAFRQKKHKRTDDNNEKQCDETKTNISNTILISNLNYSSGFSNQSNIRIENNNDDDDDEDVIVDHGVSLNVDILEHNLGELSMGTTTVLPIHRAPIMNSLKHITQKAILPAIHITGVCETEGDENSSNKGQQNQVAFRSIHHHRMSAQSGSTAYSSMRSDSMNVDSALFLPSNHSSMISLAQHPSASPYEYDCISNDNIKYEIRSNNALTIPSIQTSISPLRRSHGSSEQLLTLPRMNSTTSHLSSILTNELSPSASFCVSTLSGDIQQIPTSNSNPKMAHLLYFLQTLEYNPHLDNENI